MAEPPGASYAGPDPESPAGGTRAAPDPGRDAASAPVPRSTEGAGLADLADLAYFEVDAARNLVAMSPALERITGFDAEDVLGRSCLTVIRCDECRQGCGVFKFKEVLDVPITLSRKDGSTVEVYKSGRTFLDDDGEITGAIEVVVPAEGHVQPARNASATVDSIMRSLGRYYLTLDRAFRIAAHSPALAELVGFGPGDLVGWPAERLLGSTLFGEESPFRTQILSGDRREGVRAFVRSEEGSRMPVSLSVATFESGGPCAGLPGSYLVMLRPEKTHVDVPSFHGMISRSPAMQRIFRVIELLKENDSTVLITGESGTGKELVAHAVHASSRRAEGPLVTVNCAAIPPDLLESELFGHVRGAFTGAVRDRVGRFELADGGTLFLDEIGDLNLGLQAKLLRVLQQQTFERVGDSRTRKVDVRVIAATNQDLVRAVGDHSFRQDLYYRLRVVPIEIPPLRERREDLELLIRHFLGKLGEEGGRSLELAPTAVRALMEYPWPGNIRELENALAYATAVCEGQTIHIGDLPTEIQGSWAVAHAPGAWTHPTHRFPVTEGAPPAPSEIEERSGAVVDPQPIGPTGAAMAAAMPAAMPAPGGVGYAPQLPEHLTPAEVAEASEILAMLQRSRHRRGEAAALLGISRTTLWRKMKQYGLA